MADDLFYLPNRPPQSSRPPQPGELLFEFLRGHDRFLCELRDHGAYGIEAQFYQNEEFLYSRRFDRTMDQTKTPRELAIQWAQVERVALESGTAAD